MIAFEFKVETIIFYFQIYFYFRFKLFFPNFILFSYFIIEKIINLE